MTTTMENKDTIDQQQDSGAEAAGAAPQKFDPESVDLDRAQRDPEYLREVNKALAEHDGAATEGGEKVEQDGTQDGKAAPAPPPANGQPPEPKAGIPEEFFTFDDGDPVYRGEARRIRRAELKDLVQKGLSHGAALNQVAPYLRLARAVPELAELLEHPVYWREAVPKIADALRTVSAAGRSGVEVDLDRLKRAVPEAAELDENDLRLQMRLVNATIQQMRDSGAIAPAAADPMRDLGSIPQEMVEEESQRSLSALRSVDPHFDENRALVREAMGEIRTYLRKQLGDEAGERQFGEFYALVGNPFARDAEGNQLYLTLHREADAERIKRSQARAGTGASRGASRTTTIKLNAGGRAPSARIEPGASAGAGSGAGATDDPWAGTDEEFNRRIDAKLRRGA